MKYLYIITIFICFSSLSQQQEILEYSKLKEAYYQYDTSFFNSLKGELFQIHDKGKFIRSFVYGDGVSPILDWHLNKKADFSEYDYFYENDFFVLVIYDFDFKKKKITYRFKITGDKPRVIFKKGKRNWYKVKKLQDMVLIDKKKTPL